MSLFILPRYISPVVPLLLLLAAFLLKETALPYKTLSRALKALLAIGVAADLAMVGVQSLYNSRYDVVYEEIAKQPDLESVYSFQCLIAPYPVMFHRHDKPRV